MKPVVSGTQIIGAVPGIQHGESRVTTVGPYSPNVAMSIRSLKSIYSMYETGSLDIKFTFKNEFIFLQFKEF